jgi:uncharacterized repeat protein (TIGR03803 family)
MTSSGGDYSAGTIFSTDVNGNNHSVDYSIFRHDGQQPNEICQASNGLLYGITTSGGNNNDGVLFSFDPTNSNYTKLLDFNGTNNGSNPTGNLFQANNGLLYGMTISGGTNNLGVIFSYNPSTATYSKLLDFDGFNNGRNPRGSLIQASNGLIYGMTYGGGTNDMGVIFSFNPANSNYTKLFDFNGTASGSNPFGSLMQASNGLLYGMTNNGGTNNFGVIFSYDPVLETYTKLMNFDGTNSGGGPNGSLIEVSSGLVCGMTSSGGTLNKGVLFSYDIALETYSKLLDFDGLNNGSNPHGCLTKSNDGLIYGTTFSGGFYNMGVFFSYNPSTNAYSKVLDFNGNINGAYPYSGIISSNTNGILYGVTNSGGIGNFGIIFSYNTDNSIYSKLFDFGWGPTGSFPLDNVVQANNGKLYGMTRFGGTNNRGVIFSYEPSTSSYTKLHDFNETNGSFPCSSLMQASDGHLYGMTLEGGANNMGVIFSYDPVTSTYSKLLDFDGSNNGQNPYGSLMQATNGLLYGMTSSGGTNNLGVIFSYNPITDTYIKLLDFDGTNTGRYPKGSLIQASNGQLYGMTSWGGTSNRGIIFSYNPDTGFFTKLLDFNGANNGRYPLGSLTQAIDGLLYGMTSEGGINNLGVLFSYDPAVSTYNKLLDFDGAASGSNPKGNLLQASNGLIYGMTYQGGTNDIGVLFEYNPAISIYTKKLDFIGSNGSSPYGSIIEVCYPTINTVSTSDCDSYTWAENGQTYTVSGTYTVVSGCHTEELVLSITNSTINTTTTSACDSYTWSENGQTYTASGTYTVVTGCHTEELVLTITNSTNNTTTASACDSYTWAENGQTYTASGTYTLVTGCHTEELVLTITNSTINTTTTSACDSYTWAENGQTYTVSGTYTVVSGCHTEELVLSITNSTTNTTTTSACDSYIWVENGQTYTTSGTYTVVTGCHTEELELTINQVSDITTSLLNETITASNTNATYQWLDCDNGNAAITDATNQSFTATANGNYAVEITENGCTATSACVAVWSVGLDENGVMQRISLYPNPTSGLFFMESNLVGKNYTITDMHGRVIAQSTIDNTLMQINLENEADGIYFIRIDTQVLKLVKQ